MIGRIHFRVIKQQIIISIGKPQILVSYLFSLGGVSFSREKTLSLSVYIYREREFLVLEHKYGCWPCNGLGNKGEGLTIHLENFI